MKTIIRGIIAFLLIINISFAYQPIAKVSLDDLHFLIGDWEAVGQGKANEAKGGFSFTFDLQDKVIVRRNHAEYPEEQGRPATKHDDLMVIYADNTTELIRASYFDNEGHAINYKVEISADKQIVTFISDPISSQPRFRLTYTKQKDGNLSGKFEIAPPNKHDAFANYLEWTARKK